jgi:hypothetical protein
VHDDLFDLSESAPSAILADVPAEPDIGAWHFERFRNALETLPPALAEEDILRPELRLFADDALSLYYAPFDYVNEHARVILMGITPGRHQFWKACIVARDALVEGRASAEVLRRVKQTASFSGPMRKNLVTMLDGIGLHKALGVDSTSDLFEDKGAQLLFSTSAVSFPVFVRGRNYTGSSPRLLSNVLLRRIVEEVFAVRVSRLPEALLVPLGKVAGEVADHLAKRGKLNPARVLHGFPHPSGGNGHRVREYREHHSALTRAVATWFEKA